MIISPMSDKKLACVHPDLVRVVRRMAADWTDPDLGWIITCSGRTVAEQKLMVAKGASQTMRSRHIIAPNGYAHAVDFAMTLKGAPKWDWPLYAKMASAMKIAARAEGIPIEWGGDWKAFKDGPHFQLPWKQYPGTK
jgi:peptidoglycan L-alanyl-D-glutamate endopeptidase CwlK